MTERFQTGVHPDADEISLFLEGAATEQERAQMLEHLAGCAACREMVFLAQGAAEPEPVAEEPRPVRWWRRGWMPFGLAGAALAFGLALVIHVRQGGAPAGDRQMARVEAPAASQVNAPSTEMAKKDQAPTRESTAGKDAAGSAVRAPKSAPGVGSGGGVGVGVPLGAPPPALAANEQAMQAARGNMARLQQNAITAPAAPLPPPVAAPASALADAGSQQQQVVQEQAVGKATQGGPTATQQYSVAGVATTGRNLAALEVLHDQKLGEVSGIVTDAIGAVIGQASVSLTGGADRTVREVTTAADGRFTIADVPAGNYELQVSARGFNTRVESLELKASEVARLEPVLTVGAVSQTVAVAADNAPLDTAEVSATSLLQEEKLPGGAAATARVSMGGRVLSVDGAGHLYLSRDAGKSWKKVKPKWEGKAERLAVVPGGGGQVFEMTTHTGAVWTSEDGKHWRGSADGKR